MVFDIVARKSAKGATEFRTVQNVALRDSDSYISLSSTAAKWHSCSNYRLRTWPGEAPNNSSNTLPHSLYHGLLASMQPPKICSLIASSRIKHRMLALACLPMPSRPKR